MNSSVVESAVAIAAWQALREWDREQVLGLLAFPAPEAYACGHELLRVLAKPDRGALIVAEASASARVVDARESLHRVPPHRPADHERARVRLLQAEREHADARAALEAGGGR